MLRYLPGKTIVVTTAGGAVAVDVTPGVLYRIISDVDCFIQPTVAANGTGEDAADKSGMYFPAKVFDPHLYSFAAAGDPGDATHAASVTCQISVYAAAGKVYLTPMLPVFGA